MTHDSSESSSRVDRLSTLLSHFVSAFDTTIPSGTLCDVNGTQREEYQGWVDEAFIVAIAVFRKRCTDSGIDLETLQLTDFEVSALGDLLGRAFSVNWNGGTLSYAGTQGRPPIFEDGAVLFQIHGFLLAKQLLSAGSAPDDEQVEQLRSFATQALDGASA